MRLAVGSSQAARAALAGSRVRVALAGSSVRVASPGPTLELGAGMTPVTPATPQLGEPTHPHLESWLGFLHWLVPASRFPGTM